MKTHRPTFRSIAGPARGRNRGSALFLVMTSLAALSVLGGTFVMMATTDLRISSNYMQSVKAFQNADAGMRVVERELARLMEEGSLHLRGEQVAVDIHPPPGFDFDPVTELRRNGDKKSYHYQVTGRSGNARATIEATLRKVGGYSWSLFGELHVDLKKNSHVLNGSVASNGPIILNHNATIGGDATPGPGRAVVGNLAGVAGSVAPAQERVILEPITHSDLAWARANSNNAYIPLTFLVLEHLIVPGGTTLFLSEGVYYFKSMVVGNAAALHTTGEVIIYVDGPLDIKNGSTSNNTDADLLQIFTTTTGSVNIRHGSEFHGHIYAPYAKQIELKADGGFYGSAISGGLVDTKMNAYYNLEGSPPAGKHWGVTSWKLLR